MSEPVAIPADLERPDRVLAGLTARQVLIVASTALLLYGAWLAARPYLPLWVFAVGGVPVGLGGIGLAWFRRDGIGMDRLTAAVLAYRLRPRRLLGARPPTLLPVPDWITERATAGPTGWAHPEDARLMAAMAGRTGALRLPARSVTDLDTGDGGGVGVLDLGGHGSAVLAVAAGVAFELREPGEQQGLVDGFARMLLAVDGPVQIVVRRVRLDLRPALAELAEATPALPAPALRQAAAAHYAWLAELAALEAPLTRQVVLVLRDTATGGTHAAAVGDRLLSRLADAQRALGSAGITLTGLSAGEADEVLAGAVDPGRDTPALPVRPVGGQNVPQLGGCWPPDVASAAERGWAA
jgi:hypothetical protein